MKQEIIVKTTRIIILLIRIIRIIINFRNLIIFLITIEIMILALCLILSTHTEITTYTIRTIIILKILTIAAAETAIALSILTTYYRTRGTIRVKSLNLLRG
uniref:NADH-ubiquinone oxidoreductase chain 4L n=1 Tax=Docosaccus maculatus TaxID=1503681 RepID=A0A0K0KMR6_9METZ|nr:NADH dehydrogenase subunit 4L [Docosaccus maculatus]